MFILSLIFIAAFLPRIARLEKFTSAVRETGVSRHNGGPIDSVIVHVVSGGLYWDPMMPEDASLSDGSTSDRCFFFYFSIVYRGLN